MASTGVVLGCDGCIDNTHPSPMGHTRHTSHAGHATTKPQVTALRTDLSGALGRYPTEVREGEHMPLQEC
jgi:hypothetical protein